MGKNLKPQRDPRGHSLRIYSDLYDSPAFAALSPRDVLAYLALLRELKGYNNGDLSLPLSRATQCGIHHHVTLARSLRALCAVGLIALNRKGGCSKGGQRLASLYRITDRECYDIPSKHLTAMPATNEWKRITSVKQGLQCIEAAEAAIKKSPEKLNTAGHGVTATTSPRDGIKPLTTSRGDVWTDGLGRGVTMAKKAKNLASMRASAVFSGDAENANHRTPRVSPLYIATPIQVLSSLDEHGRYTRWTAKPSHLFTNLLH
jgi:hypothetical protein